MFYIYLMTFFYHELLTCWRNLNVPINLTIHVLYMCVGQEIHIINPWYDIIYHEVIWLSCFVAIFWILQNNYYMKHVLHLLDDFLVIDEQYVNAEIRMQRLIFVKASFTSHLNTLPSTPSDFTIGIASSTLTSVWRICSTFRKHFLDLLSFMTYHRICNYIVYLMCLGNLKFL
jgi:hypothetical protein